MQQFGLLALELTRQRSAHRYVTGARDGSPLPTLQLDEYELARQERLRAVEPQRTAPTLRSRLAGSWRRRPDEKVETLRHLAIFSGLSHRDLQAVARLVDVVEVPANYTLIREGESAHEFFVVAEGSVRVSQNGRHLAELGSGSWLGEIALMSATPRTATVATRTPAKLFVTTDRGFRQLVGGWRSIASRLEQGLAERTGALAG
jgi:CRP-like cAMP-binding protein